MHRITFQFFLIITLIACNAESKPKTPAISTMHEVKGKIQMDYDSTQWTELSAENGYMIDIRYATTNNFVNMAMYPCARLFLRPEVALALNRVRDRVKAESCRLKLFDGYRPRPVQYKLWEKVPNPSYVTDPAKGSMHNRGLAIDLTLTDMYGVELDLGTPYDFFGPAAHQDFTSLPPQVLSRRKLLKDAMEAEGFQATRTEWWHFFYTKADYPLDEWQWPCKQ
ncbi:MAG: M15 family metallopeptidase [Saprospiraceae bacterium]